MALMTKEKVTWMKEYKLRDEKLLSPEQEFVRFLLEFVEQIMQVRTLLRVTMAKFAQEEVRRIDRKIMGPD